MRPEGNGGRSKMGEKQLAEGTGFMNLNFTATHDCLQNQLWALLGVEVGPRYL